MILLAYEFGGINCREIWRPNKVMQMLPNICHQKDVKNKISVAENTVQKNFKASADDAKFRYDRTYASFYWVLGISLWIMTLKYSEKK